MATIRRLFSVLIKQKTYLNLVYLLLSFPLGVLYFITLVVGFTIGFATTLLILGVFILIGILVLVRFYIMVEKKTMEWFLRIPQIQFIPSTKDANSPIIKKWISVFRHRHTWTGILYLLLKLPIGVISFSIVVALLAGSFSLLASPLTYHLWDSQIWGPGILFWKINTLPESFIGFLLGGLLLAISLNITNFMADIIGGFAQWMLNPLAPRRNSQP